MKFVLDSWEISELKDLPERIDLFTEAVMSFGLEGLQNTMNKFNGK